MKFNLIGAVAALVLLPLGAAASTFTFSNNTPITIPGSGSSGPASIYPSGISVSGVTNVTDVNITLLGLSHTFSADLYIRVFGPTGQSVTLMQNQGGRYDWTNDNVTFSDGSWGMTSWSPGNSGWFDPVGSLSAFNGLNPNGSWGLYIYDDASRDVGYLANGWKITLRGDAVTTPAPVPLPAGLPLLAGALGLFGLLKRRKRAAA